MLDVAARLHLDGSFVRGGPTQLVVDVVNGRLSSVLRVEHEAGFVFDELGYGAVGIVQVAEGERPGLADVDAGRGGVAVHAGSEPLLQAGVDALHAEVALHGGADRVGIELLTLLLEPGQLVAGKVAGVALA
jgi:hypothetical protein